MSQERWRGAVEGVKRASARHGKSLAFGRLVALKPGEVVLYFPPAAAFHRATVTGSARATVEAALGDFFKVPTRLTTVDADPGSLAPSLAEEEAKGRASREQAIEEKIREHHAVRSVLRALGGELEHVRILEEEPGAPALPEALPPEDR